MEIWSGKVASDYDMLRVFECPAYYRMSDWKLEPRERKYVFLGFKRGVKGYKLRDSRERKIILSRDVTLDESSMIKTLSSQQMESDQTREISQWMESDASPPSPDGSISFRVSYVVTQYEHHVQEKKDTKDVVEDLELEG